MFILLFNCVDISDKEGMSNLLLLLLLRVYEFDTHSHRHTNTNGHTLRKDDY